MPRDEFRLHPGGRMLLVEEDALVRARVTAQLTEIGYRVVQAASATAAMLTIADSAPLALVIADPALAQSEGINLVTEARAIRPGVPILFITGQSNPPELASEAVLLKPFSPETLSTTILALLEHARRRADGAAALDRLAARLRSAVLRRMLAHWRRACDGSALPFHERVRVTREEMDRVAHVAVDQTRVPMTFALIKVGAELVRRAETDFSWWWRDVAADEAETWQEGAYRRCAVSGKPSYDSAVSFRPGEGAFFERLLLPCSVDGASVSSLIAVVAFDDSPSL